MNQLFTQIKKKYSSFSKGQKHIADYIVEHYDKAAFMTAATLGKKTNVSESTVVRFATELGFDGYGSLQRALQNIVRRKLTAVQRMEVTNDRLDGKDIVRNVLSADVDMIKSTMETLSHEDFKKSVEAIKKAEKIYILGVRSSATLASFMAFYLNMVFDNVRLVDASGSSEILESFYRITDRDVCVAISFPRYSKRTISAMRFVSSRHAKIITITDNEFSPTAKLADYKLLARSDMASFVDSLVAPLSLINALIVATTLDANEEVEKNFKELEQIWRDYQVYQDNEDT